VKYEKEQNKKKTGRLLEKEGKVKLKKKKSEERKVKYGR
jgi:hypothetical protein